VTDDLGLVRRTRSVNADADVMAGSPASSPKQVDRAQPSQRSDP
jgi:hypothetical protein